MNMHCATNTHVEVRKPTLLRVRTNECKANPFNRAHAHHLMAYIKRNPMALCDATAFDIEALCLATELVGE